MKEDIRKLYKEGVRQVDLAEQFGISQTKVSNICKGVDNGHHYKNIKVIDICSGETETTLPSAQEVASYLNSSTDYIYRVLRSELKTIKGYKLEV